MEVTFRAHGCARAGLAIFLLAWLAGWAAGEWFVIRVLIWAFRGGWDSVAARSLFHPMGWLVGGFVLVWTIGWTIAGLATILHLLHLLGGMDRLVITPDVWEIHRSFLRTRRIPAHEVRDVFLRRRTGALVIETTMRQIEATSFGTIHERRAIVDRYARKAALDELPHGWTETPAAGGVVIRQHRSSTEWHIRRGGLTHIARRFGRRRETSLDPGSLTLSVENDSDGDEWTTLAGTSRGKRFVLHRDMDDARTTIRLARRIEKITGWHISIPHVLHGEARIV